MEVPQYSILVPVYRGEHTIKPLTERIINVFSINKSPFEIIFIHDQGPDQSWMVIKQLRELYPNFVKGIQLSKNFGQHNALICGIKYASGDFIVTIDEDVQYRPEDIPALIEKQKEKNYDVVYGKPNDYKHNFFRNTTSKILNWLIRIGISGINPYYTSFRLIKSDVAKKILLFNSSYSFLDGFISWITNDTTHISVQHDKRYASASSYTISKLVTHSINIFVTFSLLPLRIVTYFSILTFLATFCYTFYFLLRKIFLNDLLPGFFTLVIFSGFGLGLILLSTGIIGEYIYQINIKTTRPPNFIEREII